MTFKDLYVAVTNNRLGELNKLEVAQAVVRQETNLQQQRDALNKCLFGRKRCMSGHVSKYTTGEHMQGKPGPWYCHIESDNVLQKLDSVNALYDKLALVKRKINNKHL